MTSNEIIPTGRGGRFGAVRWITAAALVLAAHAGLFVAYRMARPLQPLGAEDTAAVIIDLAPLTVAPVAQAQELAPGPPIPPPEPAEQPKPEVTPSKPELHVDSRIEAAPASVPLPLSPPSPESPPVEDAKPIDKPVGKTAEAKTRPRPPPESAAPAALRTAPVAASARQGTRDGKALPPSWVQRLLAHLNHFKRYPRGARLNHEEGVVTLNFTMDHSGHVLASHIAKSSGIRELDAEVLQMLHRAEPLPSLPLGVRADVRSFNVPIRFSLR